VVRKPEELQPRCKRGDHISIHQFLVQEGEVAAAHSCDRKEEEKKEGWVFSWLRPLKEKRGKVELSGVGGTRTITTPSRKKREKKGQLSLVELLEEGGSLERGETFCWATCMKKVKTSSSHI